MQKYKRILLFTVIFSVCILATCITIFSSYWLVGKLTVKRYDSKPEWGSAPAPIANQSVKHFLSSSVCGGDQIDDRYYIDKPASEVEAYYHQEMDKYCHASQGWKVTFTTMSCYSADESIPIQSCRYSACVLTDEAPSLREAFSVEIFQISSRRTFVWQNQNMYYLHTTPSDVQCGE